jgi:hypothetical protein
MRLLKYRMSWKSTYLGPRFLWAVALLAFTALLCLPALLPGHFLFRWDTLVYNWPMALEIRGQWLAGHIPFWSDAFQCGVPLLANPNAGVLYPPALLIHLLPFPWGYQLFLVFHVLFAGVGLFLCLRVFRVHPAAALVGALAYAFGGYAHSMWDTHNFIALPWIPLAFAALFSSAQRSWLPPALLTALAVSLLILGGDIQTALIWWPVAALWAATRPDRRLRLSILAIAAVFCLLWTAPQWLTTLCYFPESLRASGLGDALTRSLHPGRLLEFFIPHAFGGRDLWWGHLLNGSQAPFEQPWTASLHFGLIALWWAGWNTLRRRNDFRAGAPFAFAVGFLILSLGRHCPGLEYLTRLPLIGSFRYPEKHLLWVLFFGVILAGFGAQRRWAAGRAPVFRARFNPFQIRLTVLLLAAEIAILLILAGTVARYFPPASFHFVSLRALMSLIPWIGLAAILFLFRKRPASSSAALVILLATELALAWFIEKPLTTAFRPLDPPLVAQTLQALKTPEARYLTDPDLIKAPLPSFFQSLRPSEKDAVLYRELLGFNAPRLWNIPTAGGFSPLAVASFEKFKNSPRTIPLSSERSLPAFCREAAVEWLLTEKIRVELFTQAGLNPEIARNWGADGELTLLRLHPRPLCEANPPGFTTSVSFCKINPHRAFIRVPDGVESLLIRQTFIRGWSALDDRGRPQTVCAGEGPWTKILVSPGARAIDLTYHPPGWDAGLGLCALGCFLAAGWAGATTLRTHPHHPRPPNAKA